MLSIGKGRKGRDVWQVWWPILGICALHLTHPSEHTQQWVVNKHTHTHTHTAASGQPFMLRHPGSSWGYGALLKGLTSVVVLRVEESIGHSLPPLTIPCRTWDSNPQPLGYKSDSLSIRPRLPRDWSWGHDSHLTHQLAFISKQSQPM